MSENPGQVTSPSDASKGYMTNKDGIVYPKENKRAATEYISGEGSMGFERNQAVVREAFKAPEAEGGTMGQHKLQRIKAETGGSHSI